MNKKFFLVMMGVLVVGIASILYFSPSYGILDITVVIPPASTPVDAIIPATNISTNTTVLVEGPPGILPGKVIVKELIPGVVSRNTITICNNSNEPTSFSVKYRYPDFVVNGYVKASSDVPNWVSMSDIFPVVPAHSYKTITISILVPENVEVPGEKWEFWIGVIDQGQTGTIKAELCQRWLVTMS